MFINKTDACYEYGNEHESSQCVWTAEDRRWLQNASHSLIHNLILVLCTDMILQCPIIVRKCFKVLHFEDKFYAH
jgi:hypothetical protein